MTVRVGSSHSLVKEAYGLACSGRRAEATDLLQSLLGEGNLEPQVWRRAALTARACGETELEARCWRELAEKLPESAEPRWREALCADEALEPERAISLIGEALDIDPRDSTAQSLWVRFHGFYGRSNSVAEFAAGLALDAEASENARFTAANLLASHGEVARAVEAFRLLAEADGAWSDAAKARLKALAIVEAQPAGVAAAAPRITWDQPLALRPISGSKTLIVVFTGYAGGAGVPTPTLDALFAERGLSAIYTFDRRRVFHLSGGALAQTYEGALERIRVLARDWGAERIACLGVSGGGYAAIRYGLDLGAGRVAAFAPPTSLTAEVVNADLRAPAMTRRLLGKAGEMMVDLRPLACERLETTIELYYGEGMPFDRAHSEAFGGLLNVRLHRLESYSGHRALDRLVLDGGLPSLIDRLAGLGGDEPGDDTASPPADACASVPGWPWRASPRTRPNVSLARALAACGPTR